MKVHTTSSSPRTSAAPMSRLVQKFMYFSLCVVLFVCAATSAFAAEERPDALIKRITSEVMSEIKADAQLQQGDTDKIVALVNKTILPVLDFPAMTRKAVGKNWTDVSPEEKATLQEEFKTLLIRAYSGALGQATGREIKVKRLRAADDDKVVEVKTLIVGKGEPIPVTYRLEHSAEGWKIHDLSVSNAWLIEAYRADFAAIAKTGGVKELIAKLKEQNVQNAEPVTAK